MYMTAFNRVGIGSTSRLVNTSTMGSVPVFNLSSAQMMISHINTTWIRVIVSEVWNSSCPILQYQVMYREESERRWIPSGLLNFELLKLGFGNLLLLSFSLKRKKITRDFHIA